MLMNIRTETIVETNTTALTPRKIKAIATDLRRLITSDATNSQSFTTQALSAVMTRHLGGSDAGGVWDWRLAFDLMQVAAGQTVPRAANTPLETLNALGNLMAALPTETRRSERQIQLQQFSTPLDLAFVVALAAGLTKADVVLEPSAGTGSLAVMAQMFGADILLNEIDATRRALLMATFGQSVIAPVTGHDAEFIDDLAQFKRAPSVVLMNPPFASSVTRNDPTIALRHVLSALKSLRPGGRLVAIVPPSVSASVSARGCDAGLWARICALATPVLRLHLPRTAFRKMGTSVGTDLLIFDKHGADPVGAATSPTPRYPEHICPDLSAALSILDMHCPQRLALSSSQQFLRSTAVNAAPSLVRVLHKTAKRSGTVMLLPSGGRPAQNIATPLEVELLKTPRANLPISDIYASYAPQRLRITGATAHPSPLVESLAMGSVHPPQPGDMQIKLPRKIVETGALSEAQLETILMAETAFSTDLPGKFIVDDTKGERRECRGCLQRNDEDDAARAYRRGYFLGDGTGCGKGRQVAGLILAGWLEGEGRRKAVWFSKSSTLIWDSIRDWTDLGGARTDIHALSRWKPDEEINLTSGILFVTYATLRAVSQSGARRIDQIIRWLGADFDGVIAFDEAHAMQNAGGAGGSRGAKAPSQQGLAGLQLQNALPRARVLYVLATGATEVGNLAYATRLGLWGSGPGYPFPSRDDFVSSMEAGGVAAMEVVARDLKALGLYTARALSFEGVDYDILEHQLTSDQIALYDTYASAFRIIHTNLYAALEATGITAGGSSTASAGLSRKPERGPDGSSSCGGKGSAKAAGAARAAAISAFESTKQRFFNHLIQGLKCPAVIDAIRKDIAEGWAPVVQIVSTGEALLKRRLESLRPDDELIKGALTPREYVLTYLERAFPVTQQVLVEQEDGTVLSQVLRDENGTPVISREAEALRQAAMEEIMLLAGVPSALDQILWAFGADQVAEVTGRSQRPVKDASGALRIERRSASANAAETRAFMAGEKAILIFSDAGGTGRSYHAAAGSSAANAGNQKRRRHYLMEPGWRADAAIQGLGRTHRAAAGYAGGFNQRPARNRLAGHVPGQ